MLNYIDYSGPNIIEKRIIDLSCGDGDGHACERIANILEDKPYQEWKN